jgi:hypothetical protein
VTGAQPHAPAWRLWAVALVSVLWAGASLALTNGNVAVTLAPFLVAVLAWGALRMQLGWLAVGLLFICLVFDNPNERPGMGYFTTPLLAPGKLLYFALEKSVGLKGAKLFGVEVLLLVLFLLVFIRERRTIFVRPLRSAVLVALGAVIFMELYGILQGGSVRFSMLQFRPLLFLVLFSLGFGLAMRRRKFVIPVMGALVLAAFIRACFGIWGWWTVMRHGVKTDDLGGGMYVMTHSDGVLAVAAVLILAYWVLHRFSPLLLGFSGFVGGVVFFGIIINNRRLAFVGLAFALFTIYFILDRGMRGRLNRILIVLAPFLAVYIAIGLTIDRPWTRPVQVLKSVADSEDASSKTRDIENFNVMFTARDVPLLGTGFGREYNERVVAYDISRVFEAYRYVPHNSLLWLLMAGGLIGFTAFWSMLTVTSFLAIRVLRRTDRTSEKIFAMSTLSAVVVYGTQSFGDMGLYSWLGALVLGAHVGVIGNLAWHTRAWRSQLSAIEEREFEQEEREEWSAAVRRGEP